MDANSFKADKYPYRLLDNFISDFGQEATISLRQKSIPLKNRLRTSFSIGLIIKGCGA